MHYFKIVLIALIVSSCGKPPIFNKAEKAAIHLYAENFQVEKIGFTLKWIVSPSLDELSSFEITLERELKPGQTISSYIWMPDMGHGSSPIVVQQISTTTIQFTELAFIMPGLWTLHLEINENNKVIDQWQRPFTL